MKHLATYRNAYGDIMQSSLVIEEEKDSAREYAKRNGWTVEFEEWNEQ